MADGAADAGDGFADAELDGAALPLADGATDDDADGSTDALGTGGSVGSGVRMPPFPRMIPFSRIAPKTTATMITKTADGRSWILTATSDGVGATSLPVR